MFSMSKQATWEKNYNWDLPLSRLLLNFLFPPLKLLQEGQAWTSVCAEVMVVGLRSHPQKWLFKTFCLLWVIVVKWTVCSPSIATIQVRIIYRYTTRCSKRYVTRTVMFNFFAAIPRFLCLVNCKCLNKFFLKKKTNLGSGGGSAGRAVACYARGSNPVIGKIYIENLFTLNCIEKTKIKK